MVATAFGAPATASSRTRSGRMQTVTDWPAVSPPAVATLKLPPRPSRTVAAPSATLSMVPSTRLLSPMKSATKRVAGRP